MKRNYKIKAKMWRWPGDGGWYFINLDKKLFPEIRGNFGKGMIKIKAKLGETSWDTSLFPHTSQGSFLLCLNKKVREKEGLMEGDLLNIEFQIK